jgi:hypothetical protein
MKALLRYVLLLWMIPLLIGHGANTCGVSFDCPTKRHFDLTAVANAQTRIEYQGSIRLIVNGIDKSAELTHLRRFAA